MLKIEMFQSMNEPQKIAFTKHAKDRLEERKIKVDDILNCIKTGEIIKQYVDDKPLPSCLVLGQSMDKKYFAYCIKYR